MEKKTDAIFQSFLEKAERRLQERKTRKTETLYIPSLDSEIKVRALSMAEITECSEVEDKTDSNASDKYCVYLAIVEPDIRKAAMALSDQGVIKSYTEIVELFTPSEITEIATEIMKLSGVISSKKVRVVETLKN